MAFVALKGLWFGWLAWHCYPLLVDAVITPLAKMHFIVNCVLWPKNPPLFVALNCSNQLRIITSKGLENVVSMKGILMKNLSAEINRQNVLIMIVKLSAATILQ